MAGGMSKRGGWGPMAQRVAESRTPSQPQPRAAAPPPVTGPAARVKHCWVSDEHGRLPALLLEWRRTGSGFQGRVVRPVLDEELGGWVVVEEWLPASVLGPA